MFKWGCFLLDFLVKKTMNYNSDGNDNQGFEPFQLNGYENT
jgi:hypothetical protein